MISVPDGTLIRKSVQKLCVQGICFLKVFMNSYYTTFKPFLKYKPFDSSLVSLNLQHKGIREMTAKTACYSRGHFAKLSPQDFWRRIALNILLFSKTSSTTPVKI